MAGLHCIYRLQKQASPISSLCKKMLAITMSRPALCFSLSLVLSLGGLAGPVKAARSCVRV